MIVLFLLLLLIFGLSKRNAHKKALKLEELKKSNKDISKNLEDLELEKSELELKIKELEERNELLSKYEGILDADAEAKKIIEDAESTLKDAKEEAKSLLKESKEQAKSVKEKANEKANEIKEKYNAIFNNATKEYEKIIESANKKAEEIAGEAYEALNNKKDLENIASAMKSVINGYGNQCVYPSFGLMNELAEEFSHTEAGQELKKAKERTNLMISNGTAAKCDYVEVNRKEAAINFVIDAFNGKVDSILSTTKNNNYGKLEQKIRDSFYLVNHLGKPFRNAEITEQYLNSRLEELKWSVMVNELKLKEREEQRLIKEQIREEEKARREYEKAIKEAAKEEEMLMKLREQVQNELSNANSEERIKYEKQLNELEEKLKVAEEKNQRALSMAQQTKSGHIYIISNIGSLGEDVYKIGMTRRLEPLDRVKELSSASVPFSFDVHAMIFSNNAPKLEAELHKRFSRYQVNKVNPRKEFFRVRLNELKKELESLNITAKWTMVAEAKEYLESLSIDKGLADNTINQDEWNKHQNLIESENIA